MMKLIFEGEGWDHYLYWQQIDLKKMKKINSLIKDTLRNPFKGMGKPEPLKGEYSGYWSRRIDDEHRLVYHYADDTLIIVSCRYHY